MGADQSKYQTSQKKETIIENKSTEKSIQTTKQQEPKEVKEVKEQQPKEETKSKCPFGYTSAYKEKKEKEQNQKEIPKVATDGVKEVVPEKKEKDCNMKGQCKFMQERTKEFNDLPKILSHIKFELLFDNFSVQQRLIALGFSTILLGVGSRRVLNFSMLQTVRNSFIGFYGIGLFVAPEIYNPKLFQFQ